MDMTRMNWTRTMVATAAALAAGVALAAPTWLDIGKEMAADGETVRPGTDKGAGWYVVALSEIIGAEGGSSAEAMQRARLVGKRLIAGFVSGEKVGAAEETKVEEISVGDKTETRESFLQRITIDVDAVLRGAETVGTVEGEGGRKYLVIVVSSDAVDASKALQAEMGKLGPDTVCASGFAPVEDGDAAAAQKAALASAKATAVEMVLGTSVASTEVALNLNAGAKVFSNAGGFIESFRVTEEGDREGTYKVTIVAKVAKGKLMDDYGAALAQFGNVKFHVENCGDAALNAMLEEKFLEWKCPLTTDPADADYLVRAEWVFADETHPMDGRDGTRLTLTLTIRDAATGKEYLAVNNDPRKAVSFIGDRRRRIRNAADLAMKEIHGKMHKRLDAMIGHMAASGRDVRMVFDNYSETYAEVFEAIRKAIDGMPGCNGATVKTDGTARVAEICFLCQTDMDTFRKLMEEAMKTAVPKASMRPDTVSCDANTWSLTW